MKLYKLFEKKVFNIEPDLQRIKKALKEIGSPQDNFKSVLIAGTNGKGSTASFLESIFRYHNFKTGLFTSPHLVEENERWQINRKNIPDLILKQYIKDLKPVINKYSLTYFEASTLLAFKYFSDEKVDIAVIEVGLGGRWDSTNTVYPEVSIITNVSFDHTHILGNTLDKIAFEKTGITREDVPAVIGRNQKQIINWLKKRKVKEYYVRQIDFNYQKKNRFSFDYTFKDIEIKNIEPSLLGERQFENSSTAITSFIIFSKKNNVSFDKNKIKEAISSTIWNSRIQIISENPLVVIDGAHNVEAIKQTFKELKHLFPDKEIITLFSSMKDKNFNDIITIIKKYSKKIIFTQIPVSRSIDKDIISYEYRFIPNLNEAFSFAKEKIKGNQLLLITGSLYLTGNILSLIYNLDKEKYKKV